MLLGQPTEAVVAAIPVDLTDARHKVMQVGLGALENLVVPGAVLAPTVLPALPLMTDLPGRDDVFPLDARGTLDVLARFVAAALEVDLIAVVLAAAIELGRLRRIELPRNLLGFAEGARGIGLGDGDSEQQAGGCEKRNSHTQSVFLWHCPEDLYAAVIAVGDGDVVVFGDFFEQGFPVVRRFMVQAHQQGRAAALGEWVVDDLLDARTQLFITAGRRSCGGGHGWESLFCCMRIQYFTVGLFATEHKQRAYVAWGHSDWCSHEGCFRQG